MPSLDPVVDPFFSEWAGRRPEQSRSLDRASALLAALDLDPAPVPVLGVVGSKGKGSTATYAAATLSAAGLRTVLVTGPSFRGYRERVRVDGVSVTDGELSSLGEAVEAARGELPSPPRAAVTWRRAACSWSPGSCTPARSAPTCASWRPGWAATATSSGWSARRWWRLAWFLPNTWGPLATP